nr:hypothetical protein [Tanacetum cinerariifolium]
LIEHHDDDEVVVFTSQAWGRVFETREPLVRELILEFLSTFRFGEVLLGLDTPDTIQIQLAGARRRISWREFIIALGLHIRKEMKSLSFSRDSVLRLYHRIMAHSIACISQAPKKICIELGDTWALVPAGPARQESDAGRVTEEALMAPGGGDED